MISATSPSNTYQPSITLEDSKGFNFIYSRSPDDGDQWLLQGNSKPETEGLHAPWASQDPSDPVWRQIIDRVERLLDCNAKIKSVLNVTPFLDIE